MLLSHAVFYLQFCVTLCFHAVSARALQSFWPTAWCERHTLWSFSFCKVFPKVKLQGHASCPRPLPSVGSWKGWSLTPIVLHAPHSWGGKCSKKEIFFLYLINHHVIKTFERVEEYLHACSNFTDDGRSQCPSIGWLSRSYSWIFAAVKNVLTIARYLTTSPWPSHSADWLI